MKNLGQISKAFTFLTRLSLLLPIWILGACSLFIPGARGATRITLAQSTSKDAGTTSSSSLVFKTNNTAGNFIAVCIRAGVSGQVFTVGDTRGNIYHLAVQYNVTTDSPNGDTLGIFYAENIAGGANTITVSDTIQGTMRFAILEYSGVATSGSLDISSVAQGTGLQPNSGNATTTSNGDLVLGVLLSGNPENWTAESNFAIAESVPAQPNSKLIAEVGIQVTAGAVSAGASLGTADSWGGGLAAFKAGSGAGSAPNITSLNPVSGLAGAPVTISGANFGATQGTSTVNFNGMPASTTSWSATSIVAPVPKEATTGNVVVTVNGVVSNGMNFALPSGGSGIALVQHASKDAGTATSTTLAFTANNTTGNWIGVVIRAGALNEVFTITDTKGNTYHKAVQFNQTTDGFTYGIFYAENVASGANTVSVFDSASGTLRLAILEYSGVATSGSLDAITSAQGHSAAPSSGSAATTANGELLLGAVMTGASQVFTAGTGNRMEESVPAEPGTKLVIEDQIQASAGTFSANVSTGTADDWAAGFAAFKPLGGVVVSAPTITGLSPASGPTGMAVAITGTNFGSTQGTSLVKFNGVTAAPTNWTAASITTPVPSGAATGSVVVTVAGAASNGMSFTVTNTAPSITTQPANVVVTSGQTATFSVLAAGSAPLSYQWQKNNTAISGAMSASYTTPPTTVADNGESFKVTVSNSGGNTTSNTATLTVNAVSGSGTDVTTYHNDSGRTGQNLTETVLTPANVKSSTFGLKRNLLVDGLVDAEPLYLSQLDAAGTLHNVVFVATEHDSVYAFDADTGAQLWKVSMLGSGETTSDSRSCGQVTPEIGVTATPVIDRVAGRMYVVAMSKNGSSYFQRIHALDVTTGVDVLTPVTIQATYPGSGAGSSGGTVVFDPKQYKERAGLLLLNGVVYTSWASHCDISPYTAWIIGYDATSLARTSILNLTPNGSDGSVWQSGGGLAGDSQGNIYALIANGTFETTLDANGFPNKQDYGNAFVKLSTSGGTLKLADYFNMSGTVGESNADTDLGSGGPMVLPDLTNSSGKTMQLAVGAGKDGHIYVVDLTNMGKFNASSNNIYQDLAGALPNGVWGVPAYFNNTVYYCDQNNNLKAFSISNARLSTTSTKTVTSFTYPGALPAVSANGSSNGIVWALENTNPAVLHAYSASDMTTELYNSNQAAGGRDQFGNGNKYITPMIADGKVFAATRNSVAVFGLLP
jgi:hypothetical protein